MPATSGEADVGGLGPSGLLRSDLWIDRADAGEEIERRRRDGRLGEDEARHLTQLRDSRTTRSRPAASSTTTAGTVSRGSCAPRPGIASTSPLPASSRDRSSRVAATS
jgi:hypothetical protein